MQHYDGLESEKWLCNVMNDTARKALIGEQTEDTGRGKGGEGGGEREEKGTGKKSKRGRDRKGAGRRRAGGGEGATTKIVRWYEAGAKSHIHGPCV